MPVRVDPRNGGLPYLATAALTAALLLAGLLALYPVQSFDLWWHLRTGQLIWEERTIPRTDPFTYTAAGRPWVTHEWGSELGMYALERWGGIDLLVLAKAVACPLALALSATAGLVGAGSRRRLPAAALGVLLAGPLLAIRAFVRPHMVSAVMLGAVLLLLRLESATGRRRWGWLLLPLFLFWANLHSGFLLGLILVLAYWAGELGSSSLGLAGPESPPDWRLRGIWMILLPLVCLVNPHHIHALAYPVRLVASPEIREAIAELRPAWHPSFRGALFQPAGIAAGVLLAILMIGPRRRLRPELLLPGLLFTGMALGSVRGVTELGVLLPALMAVQGGRLGSRRGRAGLVASGVLLASLAGGAATVRWGVPMGPTERPRRIGLGVNPVNHPKAALDFLERHPPTGRIFSPLALSSSLIHRLWPEQKVYIDGRLDVFPPGFLRSYQELLATGRGWDEVVERHGIGAALMDYPRAGDRGLRHRLREDPDWVCAFFTDNALVYLRRSPGNQEILERFGGGFDPSLRSVTSMDEFATRAGSTGGAEALTVLDRIIALAPAERSPRVVRGRLLDRFGRTREAVAELELLLVETPSDRPLRTMLLDALLHRADLERTEHPGEAIRALKRAIQLEPMDYLARLRLGVLLAQSGRLPEARAHLEQALRIRPGDPAVRRNLERLRRLEER